MRLVDRHELMDMPDGTIYSAWEPCILGELMIKANTIKDDDDRNIDWYECPLGPNIDMNDNKFVLDTTICREAFFDEERRYLVYDKHDIEIMRLKLEGCVVNDGTELPFET